MSIDNEIEKLKNAHSQSSVVADKDMLYSKLLEDYSLAKKRIEELEVQLSEAKSSQLPSKEDVEAMSGMLDLINKLDDATIERLSKFGNK